MEGLGLRGIVALAVVVFLLVWAINLGILRWALRLNEIARTLHGMHQELKGIRVLLRVGRPQSREGDES